VRDRRRDVFADDADEDEFRDGSPTSKESQVADGGIELILIACVEKNQRREPTLHVGVAGRRGDVDRACIAERPGLDAQRCPGLLRRVLCEQRRGTAKYSHEKQKSPHKSLWQTNAHVHLQANQLKARSVAVRHP